MAKAPRSRKATPSNGTPRRPSNGATNGTGGDERMVEPGTTGRYIVLMREDSRAAGMRALKSEMGLNVASSTDFDDEAVDVDTLGGADAVVFDKIDAAVVDAPPEQMRSFSIASGDESPIIAIEPERVVYALDDDIVAELEELIGIAPAENIQPEPLTIGAMPSTFGGGTQEAAVTADYLRGLRDGFNYALGRVLADPTGGALAGDISAAAINESQFTWGLQLTRTHVSRFSGRGIRLAVLDTGMDLGHPDFRGRPITSRSFVTNQTVQDGHGHGTHCIGTAMGPRTPGRLPRYGCAYNASIFAGKVLSNQGSGGDGGILAGINWAVANRCAIVSMSLGRATTVGEPFSTVYEGVARRALLAGTLIIAAAGNESSRPGVIRPVGHPANCPSILAVGAINQALGIAPFSCGGLNPNGGNVDIAGPGVAVYSSWPRARLYNTISGTSMATPHVAGIAALWAEARGVRGAALALLLIQNARRLALPSRDVGAGLVQAP